MSKKGTSGSCLFFKSINSSSDGSAASISRSWSSSQILRDFEPTAVDFAANASDEELYLNSTDLITELDRFKLNN